MIEAERVLSLTFLAGKACRPNDRQKELPHFVGRTAVVFFRALQYISLYHTRFPFLDVAGLKSRWCRWMKSGGGGGYSVRAWP